MTENRSEQRKKTKVEISAGGIVYKKQDGRVFILMIMPAPRQDVTKTSDFKPVWTFPKGWVGDHGDEKLTETAVREVKEEGGVDAAIISKLGQVKYFFKWEGQNVFKIVYWFLMEYKDGDPSEHDSEVAESAWVPIEEAAAKLAYPTDKQTFKKAQAIIESNK
jgi:8-oxo-dGTP pyrophosphatase MutT (NUDIX family)